MRRIVLLLASMALAMILDSGVGLADSPTTKEDCKNGGYAKYGFKNQGQCIKAVKLPPPTDTTAPEIQFDYVHGDRPVSSRDDVWWYSNEPAKFTCAFQDLSTNDPVVYEPCQVDDTSGRFDFDPTQYEGKQVKFYLRAVDAAGNVTERTLTWKVDVTFPTVAITSGPEAGATVNTGTVSFGWEASDNQEVAEVQCYLKEDSRGELIYVDGSTGPEDYLCGGTSYTGESRNPATFSNLVDGEYTFRVFAADKAGQLVWAERTFTVDTSP